MKIAILPGDGIGPEITAQAVKVLNATAGQFAVDLGDAAMLGIAEAPDQRHDVEAELVMG